MIVDLGRTQTGSLRGFLVSYKGCFRPLGGDIRGWRKTPYIGAEAVKIVKSLYYKGLRTKCLSGSLFP